jgi:hypothetical protein
LVGEGLSLRRALVEAGPYGRRGGGGGVALRQDRVEGTRGGGGVGGSTRRKECIPVLAFAGLMMIKEGLLTITSDLRSVCTALSGNALGARGPADVSEQYIPNLRLALWDASVCVKHRGAQTSGCPSQSPSPSLESARPGDVPPPLGRGGRYVGWFFFSWT